MIIRFYQYIKEQQNNIDPYGEEDWGDYEYNEGDEIVANYMSYKLGFYMGEVWIIDEKGETDAWRYFYIKDKNDVKNKLLISEEEMYDCFIPIKFYHQHNN